MYNQWVICRTLLGGEYLLQSAIIARICRKAIYGLSRNRYNFTTLESRGCIF
jgi:hypothetical protein